MGLSLGVEWTVVFERILGVDPGGIFTSGTENSIQANKSKLIQIQRKFQIWVLNSNHNHPVLLTHLS